MSRASFRRQRGASREARIRLMRGGKPSMDSLPARVQPRQGTSHRAAKRRTVRHMLEGIQRDAFSYFLHEVNRANGLVRDKTSPGWPASIAAVGLALTAYPVGV